MNSWVPSRPRLVVGLAISVLGPALLAAVLLPVRDEVEGAVFGLALLLPTAVGAAVGGPVAAAVAVVGGSLTHNALFTEPYLTLRVSDTTDIVDLVVHIIVAVTVSFVVVREQQAARLAAVRGEQVARVRMLEELDRTRTALLGAVSHDLRTPLASISAAASELQATDVDFSDEDRAVLAGTIVEQSARLDRTVANLLDAGRLHSDSIRPVREAVEVDDLVREAVLGLVDGRERVQVQIAAGTPPAHVDPVLVVAALRNLVENALRHAPDGSDVDVDAAPAGGAVVVTVRDRGPGLGDVETDELFAPFRTEHGSGIGLGLAIARGFVEAHGGQLRAANAADGGAVFEIVLPGVPEPAQ